MYSHLQHFLIWVCFSGKLLHMLTSQPHFEGYYENSNLHEWAFSMFSTNCGKLFLAYLVILHLIKGYWSPSWHWHNFLTFVSKLKLKQDSWFYSHMGHHSAGGISRHLVRCLPQVFACYLFPTINFSILYRDFMMTELKFLANREERWGDSMWALWGNLSICPLLDHMDLPYHTAGELLSISCLKVWGDAQKPHDSMAYLLVRVEDTSEVGVMV